MASLESPDQGSIRSVPRRSLSVEQTSILSQRRRKCSIWAASKAVKSFGCVKALHAFWSREQRRDSRGRPRIGLGLLHREAVHLHRRVH